MLLLMLQVHLFVRHPLIIYAFCSLKIHDWKSRFPLFFKDYTKITRIISETLINIKISCNVPKESQIDSLFSALTNEGCTLSKGNPDGSDENDERLYFLQNYTGRNTLRKDIRRLPGSRISGHTSHQQRTCHCRAKR